jgi:hypothetical protein
MSNAIKKLRQSSKYSKVSEMMEQALASISEAVSSNEESTVNGKKIEFIYPTKIGLRNKKGEEFIIILSAYSNE